MEDTASFMNPQFRKNIWCRDRQGFSHKDPLENFTYISKVKEIMELCWSWPLFFNDFLIDFNSSINAAFSQLLNCFNKTSL